MTKALSVFVPDCLFKDIHIVNDWLSLRQRADCLLTYKNVSLWDKAWADLRAAPLKDWGFLKLGFLSCRCKSTPWAASTRAPVHYPCDMGVRGANVNMLKRMLTVLPRVIKSSASDPGVSHRPPASTKPGQANLLASK